MLVSWGVGWDQFLADRTNPESEDAYANGTERPLGARISGYVTRVLVTDNQPVAVGQLLFVIEDDRYWATLAQTQARLAAADATLAALAHQLAAQREAVAQTRSATGADQAQATFAAQEAARQRLILRSDLGIARVTQQAVAERRVADADVGQSRSNTGSAEAQAVALRAGLEQAQASRDLAAAQALRAGLDLAYTRIRPPVAGVLGVRRVQLGDLVSPGDEVVPLTPLDDVWVTAYFNERQLDRVLVGDPASVQFDAYPNIRLPAHVQATGPLTAQQFSAVPLDNVTGNYTKVIQRVPVRITIDPATDTLRGVLRPGLSALARIDTVVASGSATPGSAASPDASVGVRTER